MNEVFNKELSFYSSRIRSLMQEKSQWTVSCQDLFHACHTLKGLCLAAGLEDEAKTLHEIEECMLEKDEKSFKSCHQPLLVLVEELFQENSKSSPMNEFLEEFATRVSRQLSKKVDLKFVNKASDFIDVFGEYPFKKMMIHLLTNAIHHGIETPRERNLANKCSIGTIVVEVSGDNDNYFFKVSDDGRGFGQSQTNHSNLFAGRKQGLFIVETLLRGFEGELEVVTDQNFGSTILCKVPTVSFEKKQIKSA